MEDHPPRELVLECFWPGVKESCLTALDRRARNGAAELTRLGQSVRYLGSLLMLDDEVVLCRFEGAEEAVRQAAARAAIPFERIVNTTRSPGPPGADPGLPPDHDVAGGNQ